jgi:hypothetical protein
MVIDNSYNHLINLEFLNYNNQIKIFVHVQVDTWTKGLKKRFLQLLQQLGECYCLVEDQKVVKFAQLHGATLIKEAPSQGKYLYMLRFN